MIAPHPRAFLALALGAALLSSTSARAAEAPPVTDPFVGVLDPSWKPPRAPEAEKPKPQPPSSSTAASESRTTESAKERRREQRLEDASRYHDYFNDPSLLPDLQGEDTVALNLGAGLATVDDATQLTLTGRLYLGSDVVLGDTLNHALASDNPDQPVGANRHRDHDEWRDYLRLIQRFDIGKDGNRFALGKLGNVSLGESGLMQHLNNDLLLDTPRLGILIRYQDPIYWLQLVTADATLLSPVFGGQLGLRPGGGSQNQIVSSFRVSGQYVTDLEAPLALTRAAGTNVVSVADERRPNYSNERVHGYGFDVSLRPLQVGIVHAELYGAYNALISHGNGIHGGLKLGAVGDESGIELRGEIRALGGNYLPHYFDSFYDVQRVNYLTSIAGTSALTKLQFLELLNRDGRTQNFFGSIHLNASRMLGIEASYESGGYAQSAIATLHAQVVVSDDLTLFGTYQRRNFDAASTSVLPPSVTTPEEGYFKFGRNELLVGRIRMKLSSSWFITGSATRSFVFDTKGGEYRPTWSAGGALEWLVGT